MKLIENLALDTESLRKVQELTNSFKSGNDLLKKRVETLICDLTKFIQEKENIDIFLG